MDTYGAPFSGTEAEVTFRLYRSATAGAPVHVEAVILDLDQGRFAHLLGSGDALDLDLFDGSDVFLGIQVEGEPELIPRIPFPTTPYAAWAREAGRIEWDAVIEVPPAIAAGGGYTAGPGLRIDPATRQVRLNEATCLPGAGWVWNGAVFLCTNPATSVSGGFGILVTAGALRINTAEVQRRPLVASCPFGIRTLAEDGTVACAANNNVDTNVFGRSCPVVGQVLRGFDASGNPICVTDRNTNVFGGVCPNAGEVLRGYTGAGVPICTTSGFADTNVFGTQCQAGFLLTGYSATGTPLCKADVDTNTNVFGRTCTGSLVLRGYDGAGNPICVVDVDTDTTYGVAANSGLRLVGTDFRLGNRRTQRVSCVWQTYSNGGEAICPGNGFAVGWQDDNPWPLGDGDLTQCCVAELRP